MATSPPTASQQLFAELSLALVEPSRALLGMDIANLLENRLAGRTDSLPDEALVEPEIASDIIWAIHRGLPPLAWWNTPLGLACAQGALGALDERISYRDAATILGVSTSAIQGLVYRKKIVQHGDGIDLASTLKRLLDKK
ncbi:hypothetical protein [Lysinibacter sp. HNR]|uniref:hypothetical protein n=1 Tax=Lysinibacter sp. HNR TaxID=3031408 RepID=UPI0024351AAF|nr:hypothetical protein [Lysinibacter sp. HNR]WGD38462.1 hypothetical protein FrondiHNR_06015 [Lysinibacter sp. HNR]